MRTTATGSLPGTDFRGATSAVVETVSLPFMPELPGRGVEAAIVGRALGLLPDLPVDLQPSGWRLAPSPGPEHARAQRWWRRDLDDLEELLQDVTGDLKVGVAGPWTLAASLRLPRGELVVSDPGAVRDTAQALFEGITSLHAELGRRLPGLRILWQVDEPMLAAVAEGRLRTASGLHRHAPVGPQELQALLEPFTPNAVLHCCDGSSWLAVAEAAGFHGVSVDARFTASVAALDALTRLVDEGREIHLGIVDSASRAAQRPDELIARGLRVLRRVEAERDRVLDQVVLSTGCGLAGWDVPAAQRQLAWLGEASDLLAEELAR